MFRFLILTLALSVSLTAYAATTQFTRPLKLGMSGEDVRALQVFLNSSPETRITTSGPGSLGNETTYFGPKTALAVSRLQEKYKALVLTPNGLNKGTGYVGVSTLAVLNTSPVPPATHIVVSDTPVESKPKLPGNLEGLPGTIATLKRISTKNGLTEAQINELVQVVTEQVQSTTTPLLATFAARVYRDNPGQKPLTLRDQLVGLGRQFLATFIPESAYALDPVSVVTGTGLGVGTAAGIPFGGAIAGTPVFCTCTGAWWIPITQLPPTFAEALAYVPGSQAYLSYNIPATIWLLGLYTPGACLIHTGTSCSPLPVNGVITPTVGSSPI